MDDLKDFYSIGKNFTKPRNYDPIKELKSEIEDEENKLSSISDLSHDGRPRDEFSIVFNPDPDYINPDTSGNGVMCMEGYNDHYGVPDIVAMAKSKLNNLTYIICQVKAYLVKIANTIDLSPYKAMALKTIFENMCASKYTLKTEYDFSKFDQDAFFEYFVNYVEILHSIDFRWRPNNHSKGYSSAIDNLYLNKSNTIKDKVIYSFGVKTNNKETYLKNIILFDKYLSIIKMINECTSYVQYIDFNDEINKLTLKFKKEMKTMNEAEGKIAFSFIDTIYNYGIDMCKAIMSVNKFIFDIYDIISPSNSSVSSKFGINTKSIIYNIDKKNPWVSADYHLLKDLVKGTNDMSFTENIITMHNKFVKPNDIFLFLGDISESEIFDQKNKVYVQKLIEVCKRLNGIKIMLKGNNDTGPNEIYKACGFVEVYDDPILLSKCVFSHGPIVTDNGVINVHGHIHGSKNYWDIDYHDHVDAFYGLYGQPVRLNDLISSKNLKQYQEGCVTKSGMKYANKDPETMKFATNINFG